MNTGFAHLYDLLYYFSDEFEDVPAVTIDDLQIFKNVKEITGYVSLEMGDSLPELTNLSFLSNLEVIGGSGSSG